jgi:hypothetical protein
MDKELVYRNFREAVNMAPGELERWLGTEDSWRVGWKKNGGESVGHASGRRIIDIRRKRKADLTDEDYRHMQKVVGYVRRHLAQEPANPATSRWRYSLMNWGHDPLK